MEEKSRPYAERTAESLDSWAAENYAHFSGGAGQQYGQVMCDGSPAILPQHPRKSLRGARPRRPPSATRIMKTRCHDLEA